MKLIGRKLYVDWGGTVLAFEKLPGQTAQTMRLTAPSDKSMKVRLVDIIDCLGERMERNVQGDLQPVWNLGYDVNQLVTDTSMWLTVQEAQQAQQSNRNNRNRIFTLGQIGEAWVFRLNERVDEAIEWAKENAKSKDDVHSRKANSEGTVLYIFDEDLAVQFKLVFCS